MLTEIEVVHATSCAAVLVMRARRVHAWSSFRNSPVTTKSVGAEGRKPALRKEPLTAAPPREMTRDLDLLKIDADIVAIVIRSRNTSAPTGVHGEDAGEGDPEREGH